MLRMMERPAVTSGGAASHQHQEHY
jgi:hypothetical protein